MCILAKRIQFNPLVWQDFLILEVSLGTLAAAAARPLDFKQQQEQIGYLYLFVTCHLQHRDVNLRHNHRCHHPSCAASFCCSQERDGRWRKGVFSGSFHGSFHVLIAYHEEDMLDLCPSKMSHAEVAALPAVPALASSNTALADAQC